MTYPAGFFSEKAHMPPACEAKRAGTQKKERPAAKKEGA